MSIWLKTSLFLKDIEKCIKEDLEKTEAGTLSITAIYVLAALYAQDAQRPVDLVKAIGIPVTSFTPILDRMEDLRLIKRSANKNDRRSILVSLTVKGRALQQVIENAIGNAEDEWGRVGG